MKTLSARSFAARIGIRQAVIPLLLAATLLIGARHAGAQVDAFFEVTNLTLSGGDPVFPVASDVTFTNLSLTQTYADSFVRTLSLFDLDGNPQTSLDTGQIFLDSEIFRLPDPVHGAPTSATLTGGFDLTTWDIQTAFGGPITTTVVGDSFTVTLTNPVLGSTKFIDGIDAASGLAYHAGRIGVFQSVPEPGSMTLLGALGMGLAPFALRRLKRR